ncbi:PAS domain-containing protein, partial [Klebsiella pneumoniae]|uniref:PAS domain-containing protein n=1 Tax=Klebsiella pneumoniae TaxID=573 RepID=UPI003EE1BAFC
MSQIEKRLTHRLHNINLAKDNIDVFRTINRNINTFHHYLIPRRLKIHSTIYVCLLLSSSDALDVRNESVGYDSDLYSPTTLPGVNNMLKTSHPEQQLELLKSIAEGIVALFFPGVEVVIHNASTRKIAYIANNLSKRKSGDEAG